MKAMTDDLVERLLDWPYQGETMAHEAADHIEALTAERDEAWAYMSALQGDLYDAIMIKAERDRLRKELEKIADDCEAEYPPSHGAIKYAARMALKGE